MNFLGIARDSVSDKAKLVAAITTDRQSVEAADADLLKNYIRKSTTTQMRLTAETALRELKAAKAALADRSKRLTDFRYIGELRKIAERRDRNIATPGPAPI